MQTSVCVENSYCSTSNAPPKGLAWFKGGLCFGNLRFGPVEPSILTMTYYNQYNTQPAYSGNANNAANNAAYETQLLSEIVSIGTLQGLRNVKLFPRSREELLISIPIIPEKNQNYNTIFSPEDLYNPNHCQANALEPYLDPALANDGSTALFLIACYARYGRPHVWARSPLPQNISLSLSETAGPDKEKIEDRPLNLYTTSSWPLASPPNQPNNYYNKPKRIKLTDIIIELVNLVNPSLDPFDISLDEIKALPFQEQILRSSALISFLSSLNRAGYPDVDRIVSSMKELNDIVTNASTKLPMIPFRTASLA